MKKQTALQWLYAKLDQMSTRDEVCDLVYQLEEEAKAIEKEQIIEAFEVKKNRYVKKFYSDDTYSTVNEIIYTDGNQYYNETYGGDK